MDSFVWVDGEFADEFGVDEDVGVGVGDDGECALVVVFGADGDAVAGGGDGAVDHFGLVGAGWFGQWL